jgi:hypothetical protein
MTVNARITGVHEVTAEIRALMHKLEQNIDEAVEKRALKMVNDTRISAPRKTGKLKNSINIITQETKPMSRTYGTNVEYARKQEYEHKTKKAFFRNTIDRHKPLLKMDGRDAIKKTFGG